MLIFLLALLAGAMVLQEHENLITVKKKWHWSLIIEGDVHHENQKSKSCVGGCFGPDYTVDIDFELMKIQYTQKVFQKEKRLWNTMILDQKIDKPCRDRILDTLDDIQLIHWKTWYVPEDKIMEGTSWKVCIGFDDFVKYSYGENDFPQKWGVFCQLIESVTGEKFR